MTQAAATSERNGTAGEHARVPSAGLNGSPKKDFVSIPNAFIDGHAATVGAFGVAVYVVIARHLRDGKAWPSHRRIARMLNISSRTVIRAIEKLEEAGVIEVDRSWDGKNTNKYRLPWLSMAGDCVAPVTHSHKGSDSQSQPLVTHSHKGSDSQSQELNLMNKTKRKGGVSPSPFFSEDAAGLAAAWSHYSARRPRPKPEDVEPEFQELLKEHAWGAIFAAIAEPSRLKYGHMGNLKTILKKTSEAAKSKIEDQIEKQRQKRTEEEAELKRSGKGRTGHK